MKQVLIQMFSDTACSLEEFARTSSVGEFKRRLQLMLSFYGQLDAGICLGSYVRYVLLQSFILMMKIWTELVFTACNL